MPMFANLTQAECVAMLSTHHVARLAYTFHDRVDIEPISFVFAKGGLVMRTAPGSKLETLAHHPWVALEVDEVKNMFDWRSVVVHGTMYVLHEGGKEPEAEAYRAAVEALQNAVPGALGKGDPTPFRSVVMRLELDQMTGRSCRPE